MLTPAERTRLRVHLRRFPAFRPLAQPNAAAVPVAGLTAAEEQLLSPALPEHSEPAAPADSAALLAEALTGLKVLLYLVRALPLSRAAVVLVDRVGKTSRRLECQLGSLRTP